MASIKVKYRPSAVAGREGTIYYQIIHERKVRQLHTEYHVMPDEWDEKRSIVTTGRSAGRKELILYIRERIARDIERLARIDRKLSGEYLCYTAGDVVDGFNSYAYKYSLTHYMENIIFKLKMNGKVRTSETYTAALNSFKKFLALRDSGAIGLKEEDMMLDCISSEIMEAYESWHRCCGNSPNTISFYIRILRAVYNRAVEEGAIENRNPFRRVYTGVGKTVKRAVPLSCIRKIKVLDLSLLPPLDYARDMFLLSFYLRGMSFVDMTFLKKTDLKNGCLIYRRRKTGQRLTIEWTPEMQAILDKYTANPTQYLLPIIKKKGINERCAYRNAGYNINRSLKKIAEMVCAGVPLTMYVARHSWASAAKAKGVPISVISEGMGHDSESTTQIYLASLDTSVVDRANSIILKSL